MQFKIKEFIIFLLVFMVGSWAGNWINSFFGLTSAEGLWGWLAIIVPVAVIYLVWVNYAKKAAA